MIDVLKKNKKTSAVIKKFMEDKKWRPEGAGGKFAGPTMRMFLEHDCVDLGERLKEARLPRLARQVVEFCQSLWSLYKVSVTKTLCDDWRVYTEDYKAKFLALHHSIGLMDTLKQHVVVTHVPEYFKTHRWTLRASSEEYLESTHSALRKMEERFNVRTKGRKRGTVFVCPSTGDLATSPCPVPTTDRNMMFENRMLGVPRMRQLKVGETSCMDQVNVDFLSAIR